MKCVRNEQSLALPKEYQRGGICSNSSHLPQLTFWDRRCMQCVKRKTGGVTLMNVFHLRDQIDTNTVLSPRPQHLGVSLVICNGCRHVFPAASPLG